MIPEDNGNTTHQVRGGKPTIVGLSGRRRIADEPSSTHPSPPQKTEKKYEYYPSNSAAAADPPLIPPVHGHHGQLEINRDVERLRTNPRP